MSSAAKQEKYICDDDVLYTHDEVANMFQSFLDKYPERKRSGTYKGLNYEIELINEKLPIGVERDYFAFVIHLTPELIEFYKSNDDHLRAIYKYRLENRIRAEGYCDIEKGVVENTYNQCYDMPYNIHSMAVVYSYTDFQSLKTEGYVYNNVIKWIDILLTVYDNFNSTQQE